MNICDINYVDGYIDNSNDCILLEFKFNENTASRLKLLNIPSDNVIVEIDDLNTHVLGIMRELVPSAFTISGTTYMTIDMAEQLIKRCLSYSTITWSCEYSHAKTIFKICSMYDNNNLDVLSTHLKESFSSMVDSAVRRINNRGLK